MEMKKYPIGIQSFEKLREDGYLYVDKTALIYQLIRNGNYYFFSRPRRFGKSLLVNTLKAYFEGKRELFEGLAIEQLEKEWNRYPVLHFDFSTGKFETRDLLSKAIDYKLSEFEKEYGLEKGDYPVNVRMTRLIKTACEKTGRQVVILVDEYDSAMLQHIDNDVEQDGVRMEMRNLFSPIKEADPWLRFVLLTGITKFSQMSIFSELNNLENISMVPFYDTLCGISEEELTTQMRPDIEMLAQRYGESYDEMVQELKQMYDGYHFSEQKTDIYNPFSLLNAFKSQKLSPYWFGTATPTFLTKLIHKFKMDLRDLDGISCMSTRFDQPVEHVADPVPVLYQSGYLTIKDYNRQRDTYVLGFPNLEVRRGFANSLFEYANPGKASERDWLYMSYQDFKEDDDLPAFVEAIKTFYSSVSYQLSNDNERHYQALLYTLLVAFGADVQPEVATAKGRADIVLKMPAAVYVFELKYGKTAAEALAQINDRGYALAYQKDGQRVVKVGINFSPETHNIDEWVSEE
jgi:hypothetical protein